MTIPPRETHAQERTLGLGFRLLLGVLGATSLVAGIAVGAMELRGVPRGAPLAPALLVASVCAVVAAGGVMLLRGAVRGRIAVRRNAPPRR